MTWTPTGRTRSVRRAITRRRRRSSRTRRRHTGHSRSSTPPSRVRPAIRSGPGSCVPERRPRRSPARHVHRLRRWPRPPGRAHAVRGRRLCRARRRHAWPGRDVVGGRHRRSGRRRLRPRDPGSHDAWHPRPAHLLLPPPLRRRRPRRRDGGGRPARRLRARSRWCGAGHRRATRARSRRPTPAPPAARPGRRPPRAPV